LSTCHLVGCGFSLALLTRFVFLFGEFQLEKVEKVRLTNETQLEDIRQQIDEKLRSADEKRDEIIKQLQEKLRLHVRSLSLRELLNDFNCFLCR
jgi:hypothetical protein